METHSQINNENRDIIESQIRECYGRVVYSHKTHEKCADILLSKQSCIKTFQIILSAVTTGGFVETIFNDSNIGAIIGIIASTMLLILNTYSKDYDLGKIAQKHRRAAADLWMVRESYLSILTDLKLGIESINSILDRRDRLLIDLHSVYTGAPSTNYKAYSKAQEALQNMEDMTFSDEEIDAFLPTMLKKS